MSNIVYNPNTARFEKTPDKQAIRAAFDKALVLITGSDNPDGSYTPAMTNRNAIFHASGGLTESDTEILAALVDEFFNPGPAVIVDGQYIDGPDCPGASWLAE